MVSTERRLTPFASSALDGIRGAAALAVYLGHLRASLFVDAQEAHLGIVGKMIYYATGLGHQAVVVFFVLSGFLVGGSLLRTEPEPGRWRAYALARATRLYVVLLPALVLTLIIDYLGEVTFGKAGTIYGGEMHGAALGSLQPATSTTIFFGNLLFLQPRLVPFLGTNSPLWSLSYEAWFYAAFPALCIIWQEKGWLHRASVLGLIIFPSFVFSQFGMYFSIWLFGVAVAWLHQRRRRQQIQLRRPLLVGAWLPFLFSLHASRVHARWIEGWYPDVVLGLTFAAGVFVLVGAPSDLQARPRFARPLQSLAAMSFTLYCIHFPCVALAQAWLVRSHRMIPTPGTFGKAALVASGIFVFAYLLARFTEGNTGRVKRRLAQLF